MPCPLFLPDSPGADYYPGCCAADPHTGITVDKLRECCNRGYARDVCVHAASVEADAVQFLIKSDRDGIVEVAWSLERNHHPVAVGALSISAQAEPPATVLGQQAFAFSAVYFNQKTRGNV